jgi:hypothetical protein
MPWSSAPPLFQMVSDLLTLRLRAARLALVQKVRSAEAQAQALGVPTEALIKVRQTLASHPLLSLPESFLRLSSTKAESPSRLTHIVALPRKGGIF